MRLSVLVLLVTLLEVFALPTNCPDQPPNGGPTDLIPVKKIPGTELYTGIYYTIQMKKFPNAYITWTDRGDEATNQLSDLQVDLNPNHLPDYKPGAKWYNDIQWVFEPTEQDSFILRNKKFPKGLITSKDKTDTGYRHLILASDPKLVSQMLPGGSLRKEALLKPVATSEPDKYQLKLDSYPDGYVTWTDKKYGDYSHYVQVTKTNPKYQKGQEWYNDTLLIFNPVPTISNLASWK